MTTDGLNRAWWLWLSYYWQMPTAMVRLHMACIAAELKARGVDVEEARS